MRDFSSVNGPKRVELNAVAGFVALWLRVHVQQKYRQVLHSRKKILSLEVPGFFRVYLGFEESFFLLLSPISSHRRKCRAKPRRLLSR